MRAVFLAPAQADLQDLRRYIISKFGGKSWLEARTKIQATVAQIQAFPRKGSIPPELNDFHLLGYYQVISGMNRIIYQIDGEKDVIYIHIVADTRRDLNGVLAKRLIRM